MVHTYIYSQNDFIGSCSLRKQEILFRLTLPIFPSPQTNIGFFIMAISIMYKHERKQKKSRYEYATYV